MSTQDRVERVEIGERTLPGGGVIHDMRTAHEAKQTIGYIVGTDRVMSGWGRAPLTSYLAIPVRNAEEWDETLQFMHGRNDMLRVREVGRAWRPKLRDGDHLSIRTPRGRQDHPELPTWNGASRVYSKAYKHMKDHGADPDLIAALDSGDEERIKANMLRINDQIIVKGVREGKYQIKENG